MTSTQTNVEASGKAWLVNGRRLAAVYLELTKARLTALVVATGVAGYLLAVDGPIHWGQLLWLIVGTVLTAGGANGLNQCYEAPADARMVRTQGRPVVAQRISLQHAWLVSLAGAILGVFVLSAGVNTLTAALGGAAALVYVLLYTPLKQRHSVCTLVGAVVGAIPPMMGVAGATGRLGVGAWLLGTILFVWQIPHSLALAWLYREDYARGGYQLLVRGDASGARTFHMIVLYCLALLPVSLTLSLVGFTGRYYAVGALLLGSLLVGAAVQLYRTASDAWARRLFVGTVIYLPVLLVLLLADRVGVNQ